MLPSWAPNWSANSYSRKRTASPLSPLNAPFRAAGVRNEPRPLRVTQQVLLAPGLIADTIHSVGTPMATSEYDFRRDDSVSDQQIAQYKQAYRELQDLVDASTVYGLHEKSKEEAKSQIIVGGRHPARQVRANEDTIAMVKLHERYFYDLDESDRVGCEAAACLRYPRANHGRT